MSPHSLFHPQADPQQLYHLSTTYKNIYLMVEELNQLFLRESTILINVKDLEVFLNPLHYHVISVLNHWVINSENCTEQ